MRIKSTWVNNLPEVVGFWGFGRATRIDLQVCIRKKGSMDETLFIETVLFYKSLYPNLARKFKWDGDHLIEDSIFFKTDSGPGRNCKSKRAIKFQ